MAKKKKPHKKTRRARASVAPTASSRPASPSVSAVPATSAAVEPIAAVAAAQPLPAPPVVTPATPKPSNRPITIDRASYVAGDLRRVGILIVVCVVLEAILWFLFGHTGLGNTIYSHISL